MRTFGLQDTQPIGVRALASQGGEYGLWRLFENRAPCGVLVASLSRVAVLTIGRDQDANLILQDPTVSRKHCRLSLDPGGLPGRGPWQVEDLGARNGTWVGMRRLEPGEQCRIRAGETLRVGNSLYWLGDGSIGLDEPQSRLFPGFSQLTASLAERVKELHSAGRPVVISGEAATGRRLLVGQFLESLDDGVIRPVVVSPTDVSTWESALLEGSSTVQPHLVCGPLESMSDEVKGWLARELELQAIQRAKGVPSDWQYVGWSGPRASLWAADRSARSEHLLRELSRSFVELPPLDEHREDIVCMVERLRLTFGAPTLQMLAERSFDAAADVCGEVQRWMHLRWPNGLTDLIAMALPPEYQSRIQGSGLSGGFGPWRRNRSPHEALSAGRRARHISAEIGAEPPEPTHVGPPQASHTMSGGHTVRRGASDVFKVADSPTVHRMRHVSGEIELLSPAVVDAWAPDASVRDERWFAVAMSRTDLLHPAIEQAYHGNIRAFCEEAGGRLGQNADSVRRQVYRVLGSTLRSLRRGR